MPSMFRMPPDDSIFERHSPPLRPPSLASLPTTLCSSDAERMDAASALGSTAAYSMPVEQIREREYPHMNTGVYLDHGGATIYAQSLIRGFADKMMANMYGNPHSENLPAMSSGHMVDEVREKTLRFFGADPEHFDLVFVANATAAIKLVADSFRDLAEKSRAGSFWYGYHKDCHTSLVGVRELTYGNFEPFASDDDVERWLDDPASHWRRRGGSESLGLFAYPGQSNQSGRRLPREWLRRIRNPPSLQNTYTLYDAAALAMTCPLDDLFADVDAAPDFTCLSLYKIFGFPDLGALIVRRESGHILSLRKYFGGGTVSFVSAVGVSQFRHETKGLSDRFLRYNIHDGLEDGTLPFHSILALGVAIDVHRDLYGASPMHAISQHTQTLARRLYDGMAALRHSNGKPVISFVAQDHRDMSEAVGDASRQGATFAFSIVNPDGRFVEWTDVEKLANDVNVYIRAGAVCCPGGLYTTMGVEEWQWERMRSAGHTCGDMPRAIVNNIPTGIVRASLGAMSTEGDVDTFLTFLSNTFVVIGTEIVVEKAEVKKRHFSLSQVLQMPLRPQMPFRPPPPPPLFASLHVS